MPGETRQIGGDIDVDGAFSLLGSALAEATAAMAVELTRGGHGGR